MDEEPRMSAEMGEKVGEQAYEFWIGPEIERRRAARELPEDFALVGAQVIFGSGEGLPVVRLNGEVKAVAEVTAARAIEPGEVTEDDIAGYNNILLTEDDPNEGHITIVAHKGGWAIAFDFRRNAGHIAEHTQAAREFLDAAAWARREGHSRAFIDNLFSATELMAKGLLIWMPDETLRTAKSHPPIKNRFNQERKMGNVDPRFADLLNQLGKLRGSARYLDDNLTISETQMDAMLATAEEMHQVLVATSPRRAPVR
jgi:HEPN domain-containing protein